MPRIKVDNSKFVSQRYYDDENTITSAADRISDSDIGAAVAFMSAHPERLSEDQKKIISSAMQQKPQPDNRYKQQAEDAFRFAEAKIKLFDSDKQIVSMLEENGVSFDDVRKLRGQQGQSDPEISNQLAAMGIPEIVFTEKKKIDTIFDL